jgi:hypothetical protein
MLVELSMNGYDMREVALSVESGFPLPLGHCGAIEDSAINETDLMIELSWSLPDVQDLELERTHE